MKMIVALIRPELGETVLDSVGELDACVVSLSHVNDGGAPVVSGTYRGADVRSHVPLLRLEIVVDDALVDEVAETIASAARADSSTHVGPCHVFVTTLHEWLRVSDEAQVQRPVNGKFQGRTHHGRVFDVTP